MEDYKILLKIDSTYFNMCLTEPDTPLEEADHVGSFNLCWSINYGKRVSLQWGIDILKE